MSGKTIRNFHVLHRCGIVGTEFSKEKNIMLTNELLPPEIYSTATDCPSAGQCDICPLSGKCSKLRELLTNEAQGNFLLPTTFHRGESRPGPGAQGGSWGDEQLLPPGVS